MRGLMFYDAHLRGQHYCCNICGRQITNLKAWVYREGNIILFFCGYTHRCRDEFLELNSLHDVEDTNALSISEGVIMKKVEECHKTKSITKACEIADDLYKLYDQKEKVNNKNV